MVYKSTVPVFRGQFVALRVFCWVDGGCRDTRSEGCGGVRVVSVVEPTGLGRIVHGPDELRPDQRGLSDDTFDRDQFVQVLGRHGTGGQGVRTERTLERKPPGMVRRYRRGIGMRDIVHGLRQIGERLLGRWDEVRGFGQDARPEAPVELPQVVEGNGDSVGEYVQCSGGRGFLLLLQVVAVLIAGQILFVSIVLLLAVVCAVVVVVDLYGPYRVPVRGERVQKLLESTHPVTKHRIWSEESGSVPIETRGAVHS